MPGAYDRVEVGALAPTGTSSIYIWHRVFSPVPVSGGLRYRFQVVSYPVSCRFHTLVSGRVSWWFHTPCVLQLFAGFMLISVVSDRFHTQL